MNWMFHKRRQEWSCDHGVSHYDPRLVKFTAHGCDGCCARDDFPGKLQETTLTSKNKDCLEQMLFAEIDWQLLRKQKLQLINFIEANSNNQNIEFLNGILALVDHFQDCAVDSSCASEDVVFGHLFD